MRTVLVYHNPTRELLLAPPVGLGYVASATQDAGHAVRFLDLSRSRRPEAELERAMREERPGVVGFSIRNLDNAVCQRLESHLDAHDPLIEIARRGGAKVVIGGPAVSLLAERSLDLLAADFAVLGEGEETFPALLAALEEGRDPRLLPGVAARDEAGRATASPPRRLARFGPSGLERWIDWRAYERRGFTWPIQSKRGCALGCTYCSYPSLEGRLHRLRPTEEVVDEIERVARIARPRTFELVDSTFNVPVAPALALCRELRRRNLGVTLTAMGVNPLGATEELFAEMESAGFNSVMITPESASQPVLDRFHKGFGRDAVERTAERIRRSRMACAWFFLLGGPGETEATVAETLDFIERRLDWERCLTIIFTGIRIHPGTALARDEEAAGRLAAGADLSRPVFYFSPEVRESWMLERINQTIARRPNVVHAGEGSPSTWQLLLERFLYGCGAAPPYWRFVPRYLAWPPIRALRQRFPFVSEVRP
jgi:radical SAM superfamily enzyme YgiQ (UPF0313 family)